MATEFISQSVFIAENTTGTSVIASGAINQSGTLYSVIVPQASGAPNVQQIVDGQDSASGSLASGFVDNEANTGSGTYVSLSGYGLTSETAYALYVAASGSTDGLIATASGVSFTTPDITDPEFNSVTVGNITTNSATTTMNMNDAGSGYFIIVPTTSAATPSVAQIKAGTDANDTAIATGLKGSTALTANTDASISITNLQYSTNYTIYWVGTDDGSNDTAISTATFRAAVPAPGVPGRYSMNRIVRDRQRLANQITNTLRR